MSVTYLYFTFRSFPLFPVYSHFLLPLPITSFLASPINLHSYLPSQLFVTSLLPFWTCPPITLHLLSTLETPTHSSSFFSQIHFFPSLFAHSLSFLSPSRTHNLSVFIIQEESKQSHHLTVFYLFFLKTRSSLLCLILLRFLPCISFSPFWISFG